MEAQFTLTGLDKNTVTYDLGGGASPAESSFYAAGYGDFIAIEHHTMKSFGTKYALVSAVTVNGATFTTDEDAVKAINALDIFPEHYVVDSSDPRVDGLLEVIPATATPENPLVDKATLQSGLDTKQGVLLEGNGVTLTPNADGTTTITSANDLYIVVDALPAAGVENKIYLLPNDSGTYDEYGWIDGVWELLGSTPAAAVDLTDYYNKANVDTLLNAKQNTLTSGQLAAVNSGITPAKRQTYDGYASQLIGQPAYTHSVSDPGVGSLWSYSWGSIYADSSEYGLTVYLYGTEYAVEPGGSMSLPHGILASVFCYGWETTFIIPPSGRFILINETQTQ
jgi:hypothetical protein